ncbi:MAG TPA: flagellar biosynthesis regulator FlaF, partial [Alphaproteobacteria bacterium]|nr:flagellar biosynthesis regulator FlaF [Alphaproteobacteria bacterium]
AYDRVQNTTQNPRQVEYRLLAQVTGALRAAKTNPDDRSGFYNALVWNKKVWDAFLCDLVDDKNQLPKPMRQQLINLAAWVSKQTFAVMDGNASIDSLIEINVNIMDGLK